MCPMIFVGLKDTTADCELGVTFTVTVAHLATGGKSTFENAPGEDKAKHLQFTFQRLLIIMNSQFSITI